jgi:hypothetical protein
MATELDNAALEGEQELDKKEEEKKEEETKEDPLKSLSENMASISENISQVVGRLDSLEEKINQPKEEKTPVEEENKDEGWKPKSWDDVPEKAREITEQVLEEKEQERQEKIKQVEEQRKKIDDEIDKEVDELIKAGMLPAIGNQEDPEDPGKVARRELFGWAAFNDNLDLKKMATTLKTMHDNNMRFNYKTGFIEAAKKPQPEGTNVPVGSSSSRSGGTGGGPTYAEIHNMSMDTMVRKISE